MALTPNRQLASLIEASGLTYAAVAAAVRVVAAEHGEMLRTNKSTVEHWIRGSRPAGRTGWYLAQALSRRLGDALSEEDLGFSRRAGRDDDSIGLSLDTDPIETLLPLWRAELDLTRRRFLATSTYSAAAALLPLEHLGEVAERAAAAQHGRIVGMTDVAAMHDMVTAFSELDERYGGQHGRSALISYLRDDLAPLCRARFATQQIGRHMLSAASRAVHLAGFKAYDAGQHGLAQRYYLQSFALATESGAPGNDGFILRTMAMQGLKRNRADDCVALAETGLQRAKGKVDPRTEAMFRSTLAHMLAEAGRPDPAVAQVRRAHALIAAEPADDIPFWALAWGPPEAAVHARTARVFASLGDPGNAAEEYSRAAASRPMPIYARVNALNIAAEARMRLRQGNIELACAIWQRALDHMAGVHSTRTRKAITEMRRSLAPFRGRGVRCAADLDQRAAALLS